MWIGSCITEGHLGIPGNHRLNLNPEWDLLTRVSGRRCGSLSAWDGLGGISAERGIDTEAYGSLTTHQKTPDSCAPFSSPEQHRWDWEIKKKLNLPVVPKELEGMGFIAGRGLDLHAATVSFEIRFGIIYPGCKTFTGIRRSHLFHGNLCFSASDSSNLHHSQQKEAVYIKFINYLHKFSLELLKLDAGLWTLLEE